MQRELRFTVKRFSQHKHDVCGDIAPCVHYVRLEHASMRLDLLWP